MMMNTQWEGNHSNAQKL